MNWVLYSSLCLLGILDGLQPGHGKALVVGFLAGQQTKALKLLLLGLLVMATHITVNGIVAYVISTLALTQLQSGLFWWGQLFSGFAVTALACILIYQRFFSTKPEAKCCAHHQQHHPEVEAAVETTVATAPEPASAELTFWQLATLAMASSLTPCPSVMAALVSSIAMGKTVEAMLGIVSFSLGVGLVIVGVGILTMFGLNNLPLFQNKKAMFQLSRWSAVAVLIIGLFLVGKTIFFYDAHEAAEAPVSFSQSVVK